MGARRLVAEERSPESSRFAHQTSVVVTIGGIANGLDRVNLSDTSLRLKYIFVIIIFWLVALTQNGQDVVLQRNILG